MKDNENALIIHPVTETGVLDSEHTILPITRKACVLEDDTDAPIVFQRPIISTNDALTISNTPSTDPEEEPKSATISLNINELYNQLKETIFNKIYPVGSIYMSTKADLSDPRDILDFGTWEKIEGVFLVAAGTGTDSESKTVTFTIGQTGGYYNAAVINHIHTINSKTFTGSTINTKNASSDSVKSLTGQVQFCNVGPNGDMIYSATDVFSAQKSGENKTGADDYPGTFHPWNLNIDVTHKHDVSVTVNDLVMNNPNGSVAATNRNIPPYLAVNMWKRIA